MKILRITAIIVGLFTMSCFYLLIKQMINGISRDFGDGFFVGFFTMFILFYIAWRLMPEELLYRPPPD